MLIRLVIRPGTFGCWTQFAGGSWIAHPARLPPPEGLGHILMASDDKARALQAYRRVLTINPQMSDVKTIVDRLSPEVDGQDL